MTSRTTKELWQIVRRHFDKEQAAEVCWKCPCGWTNTGKRSFLRCELCGMTCTMRKFVHRISLELKKKELEKALGDAKKKADEKANAGKIDFKIWW
jgi:hypothetical protein